MSLILPYQLSKTIMMAIHQLQQVSPVTARQFKNVTINAKYNILPDIAPVEKPTIMYFGIGINGFKNIDNINAAAPYIPSFDNFDLYEPIPFRVVPVAEDLTPAERVNYRMRVMETIGGQAYWCYYLKKLVVLSTTITVAETNISTGGETPITEFSETNLRPTPNLTVLEGTDSLTKETNVYTPYSALITGEEVIEAINVKKEGNLLKARVSEIGIYTGVDRVVNLNNMGQIIAANYENPVTPSSNSYTEALYTHLGYHYTETGTELSSINASFDFRFRIGSANAFLS